MNETDKRSQILSEIADVAIQDEGDLINATIIFQHVFSVLAIRRMIDKEFRDYILKWTGIDMWKV